MNKIPESLAADDERYRIIAKIGHGGMADVFLALAQGARGFNKLVVLKVVRGSLVEDPDAATMFIDEARLAGRLSHPNVVQTLEVITYAKRPAMVMEYLEGVVLSDILRTCRGKNAPLPLPIGLRIVSDALEGLHYAHELTDFDRSPLSLVHRDVSPQNVFITYEGQVKVLDFGIAKAAISISQTRAGMFKGKVAYMAPEQVLGERVDRRVDIYAMGAVLWYIATGQQLWKKVAEGQVFIRAMSGEVPLPSSANPDVSPELERIIMRALARSPADRYPDALAMQSDVEALLASLGSKVKQRHLSEFMCELFEKEREERQRTIQQQIAALEASALRISLSDSRTESTLDPAIQSIRGSLASIDDSNSSEQAAMAATPPPRSRLRRFGLIAAVSTAAVIAVAIAVFTRSTDAAIASDPAPESASPSAVAPPVSTSAVAATESSAPALEWLEIETIPTDARVFYDDREILGRPARVQMQPDASKHMVRVEAAGYISKTVDITPGRQQRVVVTLETDRRTARGAPRARSPEPAAAPETADPVAVAPPPPAATPDSTPKGARDRIKDLDTSSPWGQPH